jgi:Protein of unknown function (DUF3048) N-terminal domain/Protein of unknown function (DUF3048) C-terminal domain
LTLTKRGKVLIGILTAAIVLGSAVAVLALTGVAKHIPVLRSLTGGNTHHARCLTGKLPSHGDAPDRPALAIKVENLPEARPQAGLDKADIVYEEPVEGGITRFIVVFYCQDAARVGPVRSARFTDPPILLQLGRETLFGFAGAAPRVDKAVEKSGVQDLSFDRPAAAGAYHRDDNRLAPHNLYTSTNALYRAGAVKKGRPRQVFHFGHESLKGKPAPTAHLDFSGSADVFWRYKPKRGAYVRFHGTEPHELESGAQVSATNVVVLSVSLRDTGIVDAAGNPSPEAETVGSGRAFVFRGGRMIAAQWSRKSENAVIHLLDRNGDPIRLARGRTWVELLPKDIAVQLG